MGAVEIGGWDREFAFRNPPAKFLEKEVEPLAEWVIWQAGLAPRLVIKETHVDGNRIRVVVENVGWLPTYVTQIGKQKKLCRGVVGEISKSGTSGSEWLVSGKLRIDLGQLEGWSHVGESASMSWGELGNENRAVLEWVVSGPGNYEVVAKHERAGTVRTTVVIP